MGCAMRWIQVNMNIIFTKATTIDTSGLLRFRIYLRASLNSKAKVLTATQTGTLQDVPARSLYHS